MNPQPQTEYQVTRKGEVIGSFTAEELSSLVKQGSLLVTDHYSSEGWPELRLLADLFPAKARATLKKERVELRHLGIAFVMFLGVVVTGLGIYAIIRTSHHTPAIEATGGTPPTSPEPSANDSQKLSEELYQRACRLRDGEGVPKDAAEAARLFRQGAEKGHAESQHSLGRLYANGEGVPKDVAKAVEWYTKAAEQGLTKSQFNLGLMYDSSKDAAKAVEWFTKAAEQGYADAQIALACMYNRGEGISKDAAKVAEWLTKAAQQGSALGQDLLGAFYYDGVPKDATKAVEWYTKAAEQRFAQAQFDLGGMYANGEGVPKDAAKAVEWYIKAAEQGYADAQHSLGTMCDSGLGTLKDAVKAAEWYRKAAEQGHAKAQFALGLEFATGNGVPKNAVQAHYWCNLAGAAGVAGARDFLSFLEKQMTPSQIAEAERLAHEFKPREAIAQTDNATPTMIMDSRPAGHGTGFFITTDGYFVTNHHVVDGTSQVRINTGSGIKAARIIRLDKANDLALLKVDGTFPALPIASSRAIALGGTVATVGFPNIQLMGFSPKLAKGDIASLAGIQDDPKYFQISVPVQPGNSGGALVDGAGNVVGVVSAKLSARAALAATGSLPENVNYAVKSSFLLSFLESVPELAGKLPDPHNGDRKFEDVVKDAQQASVLVLVY